MEIKKTTRAALFVALAFTAASAFAADAGVKSFNEQAPADFSAMRKLATEDPDKLKSIIEKGINYQIDHASERRARLMARFNEVGCGNCYESPSDFSAQAGKTVSGKEIVTVGLGMSDLSVAAFDFMIAHEKTHEVNHHADENSKMAKMLGNDGSQITPELARFSREHEFVADEGAVEHMVREGYSPSEIVDSAREVLELSAVMICSNAKLQAVIKPSGEFDQPEITECVKIVGIANKTFASRPDADHPGTELRLERIFKHATEFSNSQFGSIAKPEIGHTQNNQLSFK